MDNRSSLIKRQIYRMVNAALLAYMGLFCVGNYLGISSPGLIPILAIAIGAAALTLFAGANVKERIIGALSAAGCLCAAVFILGFSDSIHFLVSYGNWLFSMGMWQEEWLTGYEILQTLLLTLVCFLLELLLEKDLRIKAAAAIGILIYGIICLFGQIPLSKTGMAVIICFEMSILVEWIQKHWKKRKSGNMQEYMVWLLPFLVVYLVALLCMPIPQKPYDWKFFKDIYMQISENVRMISNNLIRIGREDFDISLSGFSENGALGNGIQKSNREIMTITSDRNLRSNVYLIGKVYDTFDGRQWQNVQQDTAKERYLDTVQTMYAVQQYDSQYETDYISRTKLNICYENFNSRYLFAPLKSFTIQQNNRNVALEEHDGSLFFEKKASYKTEYDTAYYQLNMGQDSFYDFLENALEPEEDALRVNLEKFAGYSDTEATPEELRKREQRIYDTCLEDVVLSEEVKSYLEEITQGAETNVQKLRKIEEALAGYTYTRTPLKLPDTVRDAGSFLDYFLLEGREGYCTYFATAFALLARAEGIPARYVQGYCVPMQAEETATVTSDMAHAWPEVYFENVGWVPFEPTPNYADKRYTSWKIKKGESAGGVTSMAEAEEPEEDLPQIPETEAEEVPEVKTGSNFGKIVQIFILSLISILLLGIIVFLLDRMIEAFRYKRMNLQEKYNVEVRRNLRILSWLGMDRAEGETLEELGKRMNQVIKLEKELHFLENYEEFLYGKRAADRTLVQLTKEEQGILLQALKKKKRWVYVAAHFGLKV